MIKLLKQSGAILTSRTHSPVAFRAFWISPIFSILLFLAGPALGHEVTLHFVGTETAHVSYNWTGHYLYSVEFGVQGPSGWRTIDSAGVGEAISGQVRDTGLEPGRHTYGFRLTGLVYQERYCDIDGQSVSGTLLFDESLSDFITKKDEFNDRIHVTVPVGKTLTIGGSAQGELYVYGTLDIQEGTYDKKLYDTGQRGLNIHLHAANEIANITGGIFNTYEEGSSFTKCKRIWVNPHKGASLDQVSESWISLHFLSKGQRLVVSDSTIHQIQCDTKYAVDDLGGGSGSGKRICHWRHVGMRAF